jgi:hypothetical protein
LSGRAIALGTRSGGLGPCRSACVPMRFACGVFRRRRAWIAAESGRDPRSRVSRPSLRAVRLCSISVMGPRTLPSLYAGRAEGRGLNPRALNQVGTKPPDRWDNADGNPAPAPQSEPSNRCLPPRGADRAVGGIRAWAENSGRRASHLPTVLRFRRLWAPIPGFVATAMNEGTRPKRCSIGQIGRLHAS